MSFWNQFDEQSGALLSIAGLLGLGATFGRLAASGTIGGLKERVDFLEQQIEGMTSTQSDAFTQEQDLWVSEPNAVKRFDRYAERKRQFAIPVVAVGNLKGGVGKTTIAANLAAFFAKRQKNVLAIDLDWQGSLANIFNAMFEANDVRSDIDAVFDENATGETLAAVAISGGRLPAHLSYIPTYKPFGNTENRVMVRWIRRELPFDAHYLLSNVLYSPFIKNRFDVVVIDTPPRMTTGMVNALACATHLIIPTVLDEVSSEAAAAFIQQANEFRLIYNPDLKWSGFVGSLTSHAPNLTTDEQRARSTLVSRVTNLGFDGAELVAKSWIPRKVAISRAAGTNLAYMQDAEVRRIFDTLFQELELDKIV